MRLVNKIKNIGDGWASLIMGLNTKLARKRAKICMSCKIGNEPGAVVGWHESFVNDEIIEIQGLKCKFCKCPLSAKLRSKNEKCPIKKW